MKGKTISKKTFWLRSFSKNFTLVEIMIVIAVIMILALLSIPQMLRANITANEVTVMSNLRNMYTALQMYYVDNVRAYPTQLSDLSNYISPQLAAGSKSGYNFSYVRVNEDMFYVNADPRTPGRTGNRYFWLDETNIVRYVEGGQASATDPPVSE